MNWTLRYASHLGYAPPERKPLFPAHGGTDIAQHVHFAKSQGLAGVLDPWFADRSAQEQQRLKAALQQTRLSCGCLVGVRLSQLRIPLWSARQDDSRLELMAMLETTMILAKELGSTIIAVLLIGDGKTDHALQLGIAKERLREAGDLAARSNMVLSVEPMVALPNGLLRTFAESVDLIRSVNHPNVKLIFDTGHVTQMGDPLLSSFVQAFDDISCVQLADMPGRVEPGAGTIDFVSLLAHAVTREFRGLIELEHGWQHHSREAEALGLAKLRELDARARKMADDQIVAS